MTFALYGHHHDFCRAEQPLDLERMTFTMTSEGTVVWLMDQPLDCSSSISRPKKKDFAMKN